MQYDTVDLLTLVEEQDKKIAELENQNQTLLSSVRETRELTKHVIEAYANSKVLIKIASQKDTTEYKTAAELAPRRLSVGETSAWGKVLSDAYMLVFRQPAPYVGSKRVYPPASAELWSTYYG